MAARYDFECKKCQHVYEEFTEYDEKGKYPKVKCPQCGSKSKIKLMSAPAFSFANPEGTDRWNSSSTGHDYRFKHNIPKVKEERAMAEAMSHMGANPYGAGGDADLDLDTGIHDAESRKGLS